MFLTGDGGKLRDARPVGGAKLHVVLQINKRPACARRRPSRLTGRVSGNSLVWRNAFPNCVVVGCVDLDGGRCGRPCFRRRQAPSSLCYLFGGEMFELARLVVLESCTLPGCGECVTKPTCGRPCVGSGVAACAVGRSSGGSGGSSLTAALTAFSLLATGPLVALGR